MKKRPAASGSDSLKKRPATSECDPSHPKWSEAKLCKLPPGKSLEIEHAVLGVIRLDWHYYPMPGDVASPESFEFPVVYCAVPGLTFEVCQSGKLSPEMEADFIKAIHWLDKEKGVSVITADCGFFMWFQKLARKHTTKPVVMSSLAMVPSVHAALHGKIAIFTANGASLAPMHDVVKDECGVEWNESRYVLVGCEDVPGFEAIAHGTEMNFEKVAPGIVNKAKQVLAEHPDVHAFLMECTQLPPFSDDVRAATGLPVYDAVTSCDFLMAGFVDNPRFGLNSWHKSFDGKREQYNLGDELEPAAKKRLVNLPKDT
jgi:hypothetical protein